MNKKLVALKKQNGIAFVTLNRPDKYNALNYEMFKAIDKTIKNIRKDSEINAVILSGADGNFSSGLDVKAIAKSPSMIAKLLFKWLPGNANLAQRVSIGWQRLPIPVIAVLDGCCFGGGMQIALGADIRIASDDAKLSIMESKWGLVPDMAGLAALRQVMPKDKALQITYSAEVLSAAEALDFGLVTEKSSQPLQRAIELAEQFMTRSPDVNAAIKMSINHSWSASTRRLLSRESLSQVRLLVGKNRIIAANREIKQTEQAYQSRQPWW
ncbi:crotonase/enoyl-CoA hydratase family protein [Shewanella sp. UCD-KL21]|uniref:crotonase/enoyl-CoA hydratase family protein n=1 Tax=Shewanella sp. UCD-KL21 TaxID=1917164 RepID=UPI000971439E|nr:crotonase/enoyl-CoA hydratase family protein [Shewanella sp. UCD-KL21]